MKAEKYNRFVEWLRDPARKPSDLAFTAGDLRYAALAIEQSGILAQLAAEASAVETLKRIGDLPSKAVEVVLRPAKDFGGGYIAEVRDAKFHRELYARYADTGVAALRALTEAEGK